MLTPEIKDRVAELIKVHGSEFNPAFDAELMLLTAVCCETYEQNFNMFQWCKIDGENFTEVDEIPDKLNCQTTLCYAGWGCFIKKLIDPNYEPCSDYIEYEATSLFDSDNDYGYELNDLFHSYERINSSNIVSVVLALLKDPDNFDVETITNRN